MSGARRPAGVDRLWPTLVSVLLVMAMLVAAMIPWWPIYESAAFVVASSAAIVVGHGHRASPARSSGGRHGPS